MKDVMNEKSLLQTSYFFLLLGIGPQEQLKSHKIQPVISKPGVGSNLQDHIMIAIDALSKNENWLGVNVFQTVNPLNYLKWFTSNPYNGPLGDTAIGSGAFIHTDFDTKDPYKRPQIQLVSLPFYILLEWGAIYADILNLSNEFLKLNEDHLGKDGVTFVPLLLRPKSSGTIKLRSADYRDHPIIEPEYLKHPDDVKTLVSALKIIKSLFDSKAFKKAKIEPFLNPLCEKHTAWSDDYYKCVVQNNVMTTYHPVGTCKMGSKNDPMAVVDPNLKVIGINNLRVIDASVMPRVVGGNTNAATVMIGEKGSSIILEEHGVKTKKKTNSKTEL